MGRGSREDPHELIEGLEGLPLLKVDVQLWKADQV